MATAAILFNAAKNGDLATVKALRESGVDVIGSRQDDGMSSILLACKNGHIDLLNHLLEQGANPNDEENYGGTCLMAAACYRHPDCVRRLIDAGADVEYVYPGDNASVIYMAAYCFSKDVEEDRSLDFEEGSVVRTVELLLEAGAPGNTPCIDRETSRRKTALQVLEEIFCEAQRARDCSNFLKRSFAGWAGGQFLRRESTDVFPDGRSEFTKEKEYQDEKLPIAIAALTTLVNGQATNGTTTNLCIATWRFQDQEVWESTIIPAFEVKHPDITVTYAPSDSSKTYYAEVPERLANGTACDVIVARPFDFSLNLFNEGYLEDVTDMTVLDNFSDVAKTAWQTDDGSKTFAIPMASVITGFIYNKDAFEALAIDVPKTQDDFYAALDKLKENGTFVPLAMGGTGDLANAYGSEKGFMSIGPNYWKGEEGRLALISGSEKLTDEQWTEPWRQLLKLVPYTGDKGMSQTHGEAMELFMSGAAAVYQVGSWELHDLEEAVNGTFSMGVFQPPVPAEGDQCYIQDHIDMAMSMNAASPNKEAARTFLDWIGSEEFSALYANALPGFFPLSKFKVAVEDELQNDIISWREDCESTIRPFFQFLDRHDPSTTSQSFTAFGEVVNKVKSPEDAAAEMQAVLETWYKPQMPATPEDDTKPGSTSSAFTAVAHKVVFATISSIVILAALSE